MYQSWAKQYGKHNTDRRADRADLHAGDIVHVSAFGQHIILLNSETTVLDLLERRSAIYSDRPKLCMSGELCVEFLGTVAQVHRQEQSGMERQCADVLLREPPPGVPETDQ